MAVTSNATGGLVLLVLAGQMWRPRHGLYRLGASAIMPAEGDRGGAGGTSVGRPTDAASVTAAAVD
ncbi:hypothetical protein [Micromonospora sp. NPDC005194]|uniref:hypothetical protein n=1 Tax=unclassified Micromonospora TaxID=2617518 RepID=UPI0033BBA217